MRGMPTKVFFFLICFCFLTLFGHVVFPTAKTYIGETYIWLRCRHVKGRCWKILHGPCRRTGSQIRLSCFFTAVFLWALSSLKMERRFRVERSLTSSYCNTSVLYVNSNTDHISLCPYTSPCLLSAWSGVEEAGCHGLCHNLYIRDSIIYKRYG